VRTLARGTAGPGLRRRIEAHQRYGGCFRPVQSVLLALAGVEC